MSTTLEPDELEDLDCDLGIGTTRSERTALRRTAIHDIEPGADWNDVEHAILTRRSIPWNILRAAMNSSADLKESMLPWKSRSSARQPRAVAKSPLVQALWYFSMRSRLFISTLLYPCGTEGSLDDIHFDPLSPMGLPA